MDDDENNFQNKVIQSAILENHKVTEAERAELMEKVMEKLKGKMTPMTEEEIGEFFDTRGF
jgi:hypothetical protein